MFNQEKDPVWPQDMLERLSNSAGLGTPWSSHKTARGGEWGGEDLGITCFGCCSPNPDKPLMDGYSFMKIPNMKYGKSSKFDFTFVCAIMLINVRGGLPG